MTREIESTASKFLVVGATGHVGSQVADLLAQRGLDVTALVRHGGAKLEVPHAASIRYVIGDLRDRASMRRALQGINVVVSTANGILPLKPGDNAASVNDAAIDLVALCEEAGVTRFVQSSVPVYRHQDRVPELAGKRRIEERLARSSMQSIVVRNAAFMDVFIPMGGFRQAQDRSPHATTRRPYDFAQRFMKVTGDLVVRWGVFLAPGGASHGTPIIATRDVAEMLVGGALYAGHDSLVVEAGGPEWLTWGQIAERIAERVGRKVHVIPLPGWLLALNRALVGRFSPAADNMLALMGFVAHFQPRWEAPDIVRRFNLPPQMTVSQYLEANYEPLARAG